MRTKGSYIIIIQIWHFRDWSLITGRGATKQQGGHVKFFPYKKGAGKSFSCAEVGAQQVLR